LNPWASLSTDLELRDPPSVRQENKGRDLVDR